MTKELDYSNSVVRSYTFKVECANNEDCVDLAAHVHYKNLDGCELRSKLHDLIGLSYETKEGTVRSKEEALLRQQSYEIDNFAHVIEQFKTAIHKQRRAMATRLTGGKVKQEDSKDPIIREGVGALYDSGKIPLIKRKPNFTNNHYYNLCTQVCEDFSSWLECSGSHSEHYSLKQKELDSYRKEYDIDLKQFEKLEYNKQFEKLEYNKWLAEMQQFVGFAPNKKFYLTWVKRWHSRLLLNKKITWSYGDDAIVIMNKFKHLWEAEDYIRLFMQESWMEDSLNESRDVTFTTFYDTINSPYFPRFGNNHDKFKITQNGHDICLTLELCHNKNITIKLIPHKQTKVWKLTNHEVMCKGKLSNRIAIEFQRSSDRHSKFLDCTEPKLVFNRNISIEDFLSGKAEFSLVFTTSHDTKELGELSRNLSFFNSAREKDSIKTYDKLPEKIKFAFLDGGISPVFSLSFWQFDKKLDDGLLVEKTVKDRLLPAGSAVKVGETQIGGIANSKVLSKIKLLNDKIKAVKSCLKLYCDCTEFVKKGVRQKSELNIRDCYVKNIFENKYAKDLIAILGVDAAEEELLITQLLSVSDEKFQHFYKTIADIVTKKIIPEYKEIKNTKKYGNTFSSDLYKWIFCVSDFIKLKKSLTYSKRPPLMKGEYHSSNEFKNDMEYLRNLKEHTLKLAASNLRDTLIANNVHVLVADDLQYFRMSSSNTKSLNRLLAIWGHREAYKVIKQSLELVNIVVVTGDPRHTSQTYVHNDDLLWGCRGNLAGKGDKTILYIEKDGKFDKVDDDINSCDVLAYRFFTRHKQIVYLKTIKFEDNYIVESSGVRILAYLNMKLGKLHKNEVFAIDKHGKLVKVKKPTKPARNKVCEMYRHGDIWLDRDSHKSTQIKLGEKASGAIAKKTPRPLAILTQ